MNHLFSPLTLRGITLSNRIAIPAMCQYSAVEGLATDWHTVHYASRAVGGAALQIVEATAVSAEGRISPADLGLWHDGLIEPVAHINRFVKAQGCVPGVQLAHAGRKASCDVGWQKRRTLGKHEGGWEPFAPSAIAFGDGFAVPSALDSAGLAKVRADFVAATRRAHAAGYQLIQLHAAHGYLLHQFLSPLSNTRQDAYGGAFEHRTRFLREIVSDVRAVWPDNLPLSVRLSATDWVEGGWNLEETIALCSLLKEMGVDLIDISSGGLAMTEEMRIGPGYQTDFAAQVRRGSGVATAAVGLITSAAQADHIIRSGQADLVLIGRDTLRDPYWPMHAAQALGKFDAVSCPLQYLRAAPTGVKGRGL